METISFISSALLPLVALLLLAFVSTIISLIIAVFKQNPKIIVWPGSILVCLVALLLMSNQIIKSEFIKLANSSKITVEITPPLSSNPSELFKTIMNNLFYTKQSGSSPTDKHLVKVCTEPETCQYIELGKDSRDPNMYWVRYKPFTHTETPIGYAKINL